MGLRVKHIPYTYNKQHDLNDVIRQYNGLPKNHSKIKQLRTEFENVNEFPLEPNSEVLIPVLTASLRIHNSGQFELTDVKNAITDEVKSEKPSNKKIIGEQTPLPTTQHLGVTSTVFDEIPAYKPFVPPPDPEKKQVPDNPTSQEKTKHTANIFGNSNTDTDNKDICDNEPKKKKHEKPKLKQSYTSEYNDKMGIEIKKGYVLRNGNIFKIVDQTEGICETPKPIIDIIGVGHGKRRRRQ